MKADNPAARLHHLLSEALKIEDGASGVTAFSRIFQTKNPALLVRRQSEMLALVHQTLDAMTDAGIDLEGVEGHWPERIFSAFGAYRPGEHWVHFKGALDPHTLQYLSFASKLLEATRKTRQIDEDQVASFRKTISELLKEVIESSEDDVLKKYLARSLRKILTSLDEYRLVGAEGLLQAIDEAVGSAVRDPEIKKRAGNPLMEKVFTGVAFVANSATIAAGVTALAGPTAKALGMG